MKTIIKKTYDFVTVSKENPSTRLCLGWRGRPCLGTNEGVWFHRCTRSTSMDFLGVGSQAGAAGIRNEKLPDGSPGTLPLPAILTSIPWNIDSI